MFCSARVFAACSRARARVYASEYTTDRGACVWHTPRNGIPSGRARTQLFLRRKRRRRRRRKKEVEKKNCFNCPSFSSTSIKCRRRDGRGRKPPRPHVQYIIIHKYIKFYKHTIYARACFSVRVCVVCVRIRRRRPSERLVYDSDFYDRRTPDFCRPVFMIVVCRYYCKRRALCTRRARHPERCD